MNRDYTNYSTQKLIDIWSQRNNYNSEVVELVRTELIIRNVDLVEIDKVAKSKLILEEKRKEKLHDLLVSITSIPMYIRAVFWPLKINNTKYLVRGIAILLILYGLYYFYIEYKYSGINDLVDLEHFFKTDKVIELIIHIGFPIASGTLILNSKTIGWYLGFIFLINTLISSIPNILVNLVNYDIIPNSFLIEFALLRFVQLVLLIRLLSGFVRIECSVNPKTALAILFSVALYSLIELVYVIQFISEGLNY